jgi:hypothetical protein
MDNNELKLAKREQNISLIKTALKCITIVLILVGYPKIGK